MEKGAIAGEFSALEEASDLTALQALLDRTVYVELLIEDTEAQAGGEGGEGGEGRRFKVQRECLEVQRNFAAVEAQALR